MFTPRKSQNLGPGRQTRMMMATHLQDGAGELGWDLLYAGRQAGGWLLGEACDRGDEVLLGGEGLASLELWAAKENGLGSCAALFANLLATNERDGAVGAVSLLVGRDSHRWN